MLTTYRIVYGLVLIVFFLNVLGTISFATAPIHVTVMSAAAAVSLICVFTLLLGFSRMRPAAFWVLVLVWEALFAWYAWFSPASPFALHEIHSFDPPIASKQSEGHYIVAGAVFASLTVWFLGYPLPA